MFYFISCFFHILSSFSSFLFFFLLFFCFSVKPSHHHRSVPATRPLSSPWQPRTARPCTSGGGGKAPPYLMVYPLVALFFVRGNKGFPILLHNHGLGWVTLTRFKPNQQKTNYCLHHVFKICTFFHFAPYPFLRFEIK